MGSFLIKMPLDKNAFKESMTDTVIATPMSILINFVMINIAFWLELSALMTTIFITSVMFVFAVVRKYFVRVEFKKRYGS